MSHHNYPGNPEITIQDCNTPRTPGSIQQYFPPNQGVCIQPNRGAIEKNQLWNNRQLYFSDKCNQPYNKTSPYSERAPKVMIGNQKIYNSYPTYNSNNSIVQNLFSIIEIPNEKYFACSAYDKLSIINGNNIEVSKTGTKNTFSISTTDNINIPGDLTVSGDTKLTDLTVTGDLKLTGIKSGSQNYVLYYNVDNNCVTYSTAPTGNGGDSLADNIHDDHLTIEGDHLTVENNFVVYGDASLCDVSACNLTVNGEVCFPGLDETTTNYILYYDDANKCITYGATPTGSGNWGDYVHDDNLTIEGDLVIYGDASFCDVSACNIDISENLVVFGDASFCDVSACNLTVNGAVCFPGLVKKSAKFTLYYNDKTGCITYDQSCCDITGTDLIVNGNLRVVGDTTLEKKLMVLGDASLCDVSACNLQVDGDASLCDVFACNLQVDGDVSAYNIDVGRDLVVVRDTQLQGKLTVGGETLLNAKLVVDADASFCDVSACNLQVDGSACFTGLVKTTANHILYYDSTSGCITYDVSENGVINSDLDIQGDVTVDGGMEIILGLEVGHDLTVDGDFVLKGDASLCDVSACNIDILEKLVVFGDASFCDVSACNLQVDGSACFTNLVKTTANHILYYNSTSGCITYDVSENGVINSDVTINGDVTVDGGMEIILGLEVGHDLTVDGDFVLKGDASLCDVSACNIDILEKLVVFGDASFCDVSACNLQVDGSACFTGLEQASSNYTLYYDAENGCITYDTSGANVADDFLVQGNLRVLGDTELVGDLRVEGDASLCDVSACNLDISNNLTVKGDRVCFKGLDETTTNYTLYYDDQTKCVTYGTKCCDNIDDLDVAGMLTVEGDLRVRGDASLCDVSACNVDISNNLNVGENVEISGHTGVKTLGVAIEISVAGDLSVAGSTKLQDTSASNIDISENLIVRGDASLCDVSACQLDIVHPNLIFIDNLGLQWEFNGNKIERNPNLNFAEPSDFRTLGIDPGDVLHIYWQQQTVGAPTDPWTQHKQIVTVREIRQSFMLIAERFSAAAPMPAEMANDFKIHVNKKKLKMETSRGKNYAVGNNVQDLTGERVYSNWRLDNFGDLHIIPSGFTGTGCSPDVDYGQVQCDELAIAGAPGCDGDLKIWGRTKILRGADPSPNDSNGDSKLEIICYNSKAARKGEAWLTLKSSHDEAPCRIYFGNVGNKSVDTNVPDCANADGLGRIEYINSTGHIADRMRFGVSDGRVSGDVPKFMEALSINTQPNATINTDYRPYIGVSESNPNFKLHINHNETGPILALDGGTGRENTLVFGTAPGGITYIDASKSSVFPGGSNLQLRAGGITVATCLPNSGTYPNAFDLTSQKLTIRDVAGVANQVLTATGNGAEVAWRTPTGGGGGGSNSSGCVIPYEPWNINILDTVVANTGTPQIVSGRALYMQFIAPSTGPYTHMEVYTTGASSTTFDGTIGVAIYNNDPLSNGSTPTTVGQPNTLLGYGIKNCSGGCNMSGAYTKIQFTSASVNLTANVKYWAAIAWNNTNSNNKIINWATYDDSVNTVVKCTLRDNGGIYNGNSFAVDPGSSFVEYKPTWFRIHGDCGGVGVTRAVIPYEPWHATNCLSWIDSIRDYVYMHQFHAPSTGRYDRMTLSLATTVHETLHPFTGFSGYIGVALYDNIEVDGRPGRPTGSTIAKGVNNYDTLANGGLGPQVLSKEYVTVEFDNSVELTANTLYWAAISRRDHGIQNSHNQIIRFYKSDDYHTSSYKVIQSNHDTNGHTVLSTGTWPVIGANTGLTEVTSSAFWFRISGPDVASGQINDLAVYGDLQVFGDTEVTNITVTGDATLQDISASNIGITGDASFCDIYTCNIDAAGTVNISDTAALPNKLVINNVGSTNPSTHAPHNYDSDFTSVSAAGYSYIKCKMTANNNVFSNFQVDGDGSIKNQGSITTYYGTWGNTSAKRLSFVAQDTSFNSLITNTHSFGTLDLALQCSNPSTGVGTVKIVPSKGKIGTDFQFENVSTATNWRNTLYWSHEKTTDDEELLFMSARRLSSGALGSMMNFDFCYGTGSSTDNILSLEQPSNQTTFQQPQITIGNANTTVILGSGVQNPFTYSQTGSEVSCSFIDCNDISCNTFRGDYIDSLRYNQLTIGKKSTYVEIACSGTAPTWLSRGGIHLGIDSDITCGDSTISCTSNSNICNTRHKGTIGTFSGSSSCGTKVRGYSSVTMTSLVGGVAAKLCVLKNKVEQQGFDPGFVTCSSVEGPQAIIMMRGQALLYAPRDVPQDKWAWGTMKINIDSATLAAGTEVPLNFPDRNRLLKPHSVPWINGQQGMPPGTFNRMFDVANATFMVTSGTVYSRDHAPNEQPLWEAVRNYRDLDYKNVYGRLITAIPSAGQSGGEAQFEIGARMFNFEPEGNGAVEGLIVNYLITVPRRFWGSGETPNNPECFFADVEKTAVSQSDPSGEYFWNPYKTKDQINNHGGFGRWDDNGPARALDPEDHNHEEYASGDLQPGDDGYQKTYTQLNTCTGTDYETCGIATADPRGDGHSPAEAAWTPLDDGPGPVGSTPSHGRYALTQNNHFWEETFIDPVANDENWRTGIWLQYKLPQAETVTRYSFTMHHNDAAANTHGRDRYITEYRGRLPTAFRLWGSNDGENFIKLDTQGLAPDDPVDWIAGDTITTSQDKDFDITNSVPYQYYRLQPLKKGFGANENIIRIVHIKLFRKRLPGDATPGGNGNALVQPEIL